MGEFRLGQEFFCISPAQFAEINKAANEIGLMAHVFAIDGEGDNKEISFELVRLKS